MKKKLIIVAVGALVVCGLLLSSGALAGVEKNEKNGFQVNGPHYNLNIIGVDKGDKTVGDSSGHTMFVKLTGRTKIIMTQNESGVFDVVDRNGLDGTAEFNIAPGHYNVYARALGKPGGKVNITAWGEFQEHDTTKLLLLGYVNINRTTKKPKSVNINELFYVDVTLSILDEEGNIVEVVYTDFWVFDIPELLEYYWGYNNEGLKLLQVRFYECQLINPEDYPSGPADYPKDYCRWGDSSPIVSTRNGEVIAD